MTVSKNLFNLAKSPLGDVIVGLAFGKLSKLLPVKRILETDKVIAFWHPKPFWEKHILIVPKKAIKNITSLTDQDLPYIDEVFRVTKDLVVEFGWDVKDYSLLANGGDSQKVHQLHFHLHSGEELE